MAWLSNVKGIKLRAFLPTQWHWRIVTFSMKRLILSVCLGVFLVSGCVQFLAGIHSIGTQNEPVHFHVSDHHHNHDGAKTMPAHSSTEDPIIVFIDATFSPTLSSHTHPLFALNGMLKWKRTFLLVFEQTQILDIKNNSPPGHSVLEHSYFPLAPPLAS